MTFKVGDYVVPVGIPDYYKIADPNPDGERTWQQFYTGQLGRLGTVLLSDGDPDRKWSVKFPAYPTYGWFNTEDLRHATYAEILEYKLTL